MERISIFNYEAFYLDFLEGNLSEQDTTLLLEFLDKHPELVVDMDAMPELEQPTQQIGAAFRDQLKQPDLDQDAITLLNVESFIIASVEQQLPASKERELGAFLHEHPEWAAAYATYEKIKLTPDLSITYPEKSELRQRRVVVLWPSIAVAASIAVFVLLYGMWREQPTPGTGSGLAHDDHEVTTDTLNRTNLTPSGVQTAADQQNTEKEQQTRFIHTSDGTQQPTAGNEGPGKNKTEKRQVRPSMQVASLQKHDAQLEQSPRTDGIVSLNYPVHSPDRSNVHTAQEKQQTEYMAMNDLKNPIKPITRRLSELTDTEIDVRTAKTTEEKRGGFYLKIGKLEVAHPSRKR